jgi:putative transposase
MIACRGLASEVGTAAACLSLDVPRATYYRRIGSSAEAIIRPRPTPERALSLGERQAALEALHSDRFADRAPAEVYATLLDEGTYLCSIRTMYRVLADASEVRERRNQLRHPHYQAPELLATAPNQVWSWDITKLLGPVKWSYFYLYVIIDIFSRYVVGWMVAPRESGPLAERLIEETCEKQRIQPGQLTIHADRGTSMTSKPVALLLADLGVTKTHSRPRVSDDNPFSESQFKTLKYCPEFPTRFGSIEHSRGFCQEFFPWYNIEHRHSGIGLLTPETVHYGRAYQVTAQRQVVLAAAYGDHPERFVRGTPKPPAVPEAAWINKPGPDSKATQDSAAPQNASIPGAVGYGPPSDRLSQGILEADPTDRASQVPRFDNKFVGEVSQSH